MFNDFSDESFYKNYQNNCIDFVYRPDLFNNIYIDYAHIFNSLKIKDDIVQRIQQFIQQNFNENTISIHIRSWIDCPSRANSFDINKFYNKIEEFNNGINTFFISCDNKSICYNIKQKFGNKIIIYESHDQFLSVVNDFIELMLLSKNNILIGTYISTFTELAYIINYNINKKLIII